MKKTVTWMLAGALSLGCALIAQAADTSGDTEKAVAALEQNWAQVQRDHNTNLEASWLAEKFLAVDTEGKISDRAQFMAGEEASKYSSVNVEELQVTAFGDTAIASVLATFKGTDPEGKAFDYLFALDRYLGEDARR